MIALFLKEGKIMAAEVPIKPEWNQNYLPHDRLYVEAMHEKLQAYESDVKSALASGYEVEDQEGVLDLITPENLKIEPMVLFPIPNFKMKKKIHCDDYHYHDRPSCFVAILTPVTK